MSGIGGLYLILLAAVAGYLLIARVPSILHTPMMSGSNFIHGIVLAGAMLALGNAQGTIEQVIGFIAVTAGAANVVGGFVITDRMLALFNHKSMKRGSSSTAGGRHNPVGEDRRLPGAKNRPLSRSESVPVTRKGTDRSSGDNA
ncbi:NAD(P) transhydrogenase subunit alpha [Granulosicoccus antarcticus IMCC3135]|uniref:proton-translocating NAD(P)(+) transhydrogenase n=1 Tax=Granulosicoccus antarcticus IMCC3135 TaxID=1192854 RepID=A0A2Z2NNK2_9GAMM|nr:NAD(P) transhydrogenase subunit alpha [Granulosicoccus antarcticus IMCC3135]